MRSGGPPHHKSAQFGATAAFIQPLSLDANEINLFNSATTIIVLVVGIEIEMISSITFVTIAAIGGIIIITLDIANNRFAFSLKADPVPDEGASATRGVASVTSSLGYCPPLWATAGYVLLL